MQSSKAAFNFCFSMVYLTFSTYKSSRPHLMLKTTSYYRPVPPLPQQNFTSDSSRDASEKHVIIFFHPPQDQSKRVWLQRAGALWRCYMCISLGGVWGGAKKVVRFDSSVAWACHSPALHSLLLFAFQFSDGIYSVLLLFCLKKRPGVLF